MIFRPAVTCGFACQVFAVAGIFQEGVLVIIPQLFYKRELGISGSATLVKGADHTFCTDSLKLEYGYLYGGIKRTIHTKIHPRVR